MGCSGTLGKNFAWFPNSPCSFLPLAIFGLRGCETAFLSGSFSEIEISEKPYVTRTAQGYVLHVDQTTGVPGRFWGQPLIAEWDVVYPGPSW